jgi:chemotaxis-related protein WspB
VLFLLLYLDHECYAIDSAAVSQVLPLLEIRALPRAPAAVAGVIAFEGSVVPVIDLSELALGRPSRQHLSTRIVLVAYPDLLGQPHQLGLIAERATSTFRCEASEFKPSGVSNLEARYLGHVANGPNGLVQRIELRELLTPAICSLLFETALLRA